MRQRGRPSAASFSEALFPGDRPKPPDELAADEAVEWNKIVQRLPQNWFPAETHPVLIQLCRHICTARRIADEMNRTKDQPIQVAATFDRFRELQKMQAQTSSVIANLSVKLRLTKSAQTDSKVAAQGAGRTTGQPKPWMLPADDDSDEVTTQ